MLSDNDDDILNNLDRPEIKRLAYMLDLFDRLNLGDVMSLMPYSIFTAVMILRIEKAYHNRGVVL